MIYINKIKYLFYITLFCTHFFSYSAHLFDSAKTLFIPAKEQQEEQLEQLKKEIIPLQQDVKGQLKVLSGAIATFSQTLEEVKQQLLNTPTKDVDFLHKKNSLLNEIQQTIFNNQFFLKEIISDVEGQIAILEEYKKDSTFKGLHIEPRSFYTFEMIQNYNRRVVHQEDTVKHILAQRNDATAELENRKKKLATVLKEYQEKKKSQEEFGTVVSDKAKALDEFSFAQRGELVDLEEKLALYEKQLAELKVQEISKRLALINTRLFVEQEKLHVLQENLEKAKTSLRVTEADIHSEYEKLEKRKQESLLAKDTRYDEIKKLSTQRDTIKKELEVLNKRYTGQGITVRDLTSWTVDNKSLDGYSALIEMGFKNAQIALLDRKIDSLRAQIDLEEATFKREELSALILSTWFKITQRKFRNNEEIRKEVKKFKDLKAETQRESAVLQEKLTGATNALNIQNKELNSLRLFAKEFPAEKEILFRRYPQRYEGLLTILPEAEKSLAEQIETNSKLIELYSSLIATNDDIVKEISFIEAELEEKSIWQRSEYAISWQGFKNIGNDISYFIADVYQLARLYKDYIKEIIWTELAMLVSQPGTLVLLVLAILFLIMVYIGLRRHLPYLSIQLLNMAKGKNLVARFQRIIAAFLQFCSYHITGIFIWLTLLFLVYIEFIADLFPRIVFCLVSIVFLWYLSIRLVKFLMAFNREQGYTLFSKSFEHRFYIVFLAFCWVTIFVIFFREAFIIATIHKTEFSTILLAVYSVFLRILIIFSIGKEELVGLFAHKQGVVWNWLARVVEHYYYPLLALIILLMVISDPYVGGYGNLVSYLLWALLGTFILVQLFHLAYQYIKRYSVPLFFYSDEEILRERFPSAKTWYGVFIIVISIVCIVVALLAISKVWMIAFSWQTVENFFSFPLFNTGFDKTTGQVIWFTPLKLFMVIGFILSGFLIAIIFNRFILRLIFGILPVDLGIQNTIVSLSRYLIVVIAIYMGFEWAGIGTLLLALGVVIGSIGYIVKEPIGDFISYFIILVQRPIQIGDYIMLDEENQGTVRKITPRSVILRRKDSYTIILPNSMLLNRPIYNWNYARNFIAFDDIEFTIPYSVDPVVVKSLIMQVLDQNPDILKTPRPIIRLNEFGEYGFIFKVRGFTSDINIARKWDIASDIRFSLTKTFKENNIKIAVPTRVIVTAQE